MHVKRTFETEIAKGIYSFLALDAVLLSSLRITVDTASSPTTKHAHKNSK